MPLNLSDLIGGLLYPLISRTVVRRSDGHNALEVFRDYLKQRDFSHLDKITDPIGRVLLEEAFRRAAAYEKDGRPRTGRFLGEMKRIANDMTAICDGNANADERIVSILRFHKVL